MLNLEPIYIDYLHYNLVPLMNDSRMFKIYPVFSVSKRKLCLWMRLSVYLKFSQFCRTAWLGCHQLINIRMKSQGSLLECFQLIGIKSQFETLTEALQESPYSAASPPPSRPPEKHPT